MVMHLLLSFGVSLALLSALLKTRWVKIFLDTPDRRKMHQRLVPRMGGFGIIVASLVGLMLGGLDRAEAVLVSGAGALLLLGLLDDSSLPYYLQCWWAQKRQSSLKVEKFSLRVRYKLMLEVGLVVFAVQFLDLAPAVLHFGNSSFLLPGYVAFPATCFWLLGVMNAFNLIDGIDGLCGGVAFLSLLAIAYLGGVLGLPTVSLAALVVAAGVLGFLVLNISPARLFMGDMGSLFVGFAVALLSLLLLQSSVQPVNMLSVFFLAGLPVLDVFVAIYRRWSDVPAGSAFKTRLKRIVGADNNHMHHRLLYLGMGHLRAALVLYIISSVLLLGAILLVLVSPAMQPWVLVYLLVSVVLALAPIYYRTQVEQLRQGLLQTLRTFGERSWRVAVVCESAEVRDAIACQKNLPFEFVYYTRAELAKPHGATLHAVLVEQLPGESPESLLSYVQDYVSAFAVPMALVSASPDQPADTLRDHPQFQEMSALVSVYNRPLYIWPLLLKLLEQLHAGRPLGAMNMVRSSVMG